MPKTYRITFAPMGLAATVKPDTTMMKVAASLDIPLRSDCGGKGLCGKCLVIAKPPENLTPLSEAEMNLLTPWQKKDGYRLACQARIKGPITVTIPEYLEDSREARGKTGLSGFFPVDPTIERLVIS